MTHAPNYHHLHTGNAQMLIGATVFDYAVKPDQLKAFIGDPGHKLVFAEIDGTAIGFASGTILLHPDKPPAFFIAEVSVREDLRARGIGAQLVSRLNDLARALGCQGIWLATESDNQAARALYRKVDGRETGNIVVYDWDDAMDEPG